MSLIITVLLVLVAAVCGALGFYLGNTLWTQPHRQWLRCGAFPFIPVYNFIVI